MSRRTDLWDDRRPLPQPAGSALIDHLQIFSGLDRAAIERLIWTALWIAVLLLLRSSLLVLLKRRGVDPVVRYRVRRSTGYVVSSLSLFLIAAFWLRGFHSVATFVGLLSAGLAIALKDVMANLAGWVLLLWRRPFELGDRIEIDGVRGDVVDIRLFQHSLMEIGNWIEGDERTGRLLHVPNARVLNAIIANYTKGWFEHIWDELSLLVTFESNWEEARRLLQAIVDASAPTPAEGFQLQPGATAILVMDANTQSAVMVAVKDSGIQLKVRYICDPRKRGAVRQKIWEAVLRAFAKRDDIEFAYPTQRTYLRGTEGKSARVKS